MLIGVQHERSVIEGGMPGGPHPDQARREVALPDTCLAARESCLQYLPKSVAGTIPLLQVNIMTA